MQDDTWEYITPIKILSKMIPYSWIKCAWKTNNAMKFGHHIKHIKHDHEQIHLEMNSRLFKPVGFKCIYLNMKPQWTCSLYDNLTYKVYEHKVREIN